MDHWRRNPTGGHVLSAFRTGVTQERVRLQGKAGDEELRKAARDGLRMQPDPYDNTKPMR